MKIYKGIAALAPFQQKKLLKQVRSIDPNIISVNAEYIHFVKYGSPLTAASQKQLKALLAYGSPFVGERHKKVILVIPRPGTISPWSSKATDIIKNSGLTQVERVERGVAFYLLSSKKIETKRIMSLFYDRMIETVVEGEQKAALLFTETKPVTFKKITLGASGRKRIAEANVNLGLALEGDEIDYLVEAYRQLDRDPTDVELMMFAQVNSEHCRHKIFNADWIVDGKPQPKSLFKMIKNTYEKAGDGILSAYTDNAAVLLGHDTQRFYPDHKSKEYKQHRSNSHLVIKAETHNHPTAIAPFPGSATGAGGEIRDEGATGRGAKPKMGLTGYTVSNLNIPGHIQPWEASYGRPDRITSPLDIMIEAPLGGAAFNNEFGRPNLNGYFRTFEQNIDRKQWGYHKPLMIAGGLGSISNEQVRKQTLPAGAEIIVLGGPSMLIGLGGGAAASMQTGKSEEDLDFASVQRANAELQRRAQEVINTCWSMGTKNPIMSIHDVGAGGLSNALPELVNDSSLGAAFELRKFPTSEPGMTPMEIWCNEAQERYVIGIKTKDLDTFERICSRERCPFAIVGKTTKEKRLILSDSIFNNKPIDLPMNVLFGKPPRMTRRFVTKIHRPEKLDLTDINLADAVTRVLLLPAVASKKFLITIGDRSVGGLTARDQMIGRWQVPVSDVAVTSASFGDKHGEAMAMGERSPLALTDSSAAARIAIGEAITNIAAAQINKISDVKLSANWMAASGEGDEDQKLFEAVKAVGEDFCPQLGITIPVGKDSLSMKTIWRERGRDKAVTSPVSLIISAFATVSDVANTLTPELQKSDGSSLLLVDLGLGKNRLSGSALAQVYSKHGGVAPDIDAKLLKRYFKCVQSLKKSGKILAYHDRSDGGLLTTLLEMMFASRIGLKISLDKLSGNSLEKLFNEELGSVLQVSLKNKNQVIKSLTDSIGPHVHEIGTTASNQSIAIESEGKIIYQNSRAQLEKWWATTSYQIQSLRDNPECADQEFKNIDDNEDPGLFARIPLPPKARSYKTRPKVAVFREEGVNGQVEMAAAFDKAGFKSIDVHLTDILNGSVVLDDFVGLVACGGFSYGDVLGAGEGWAKSILFNDQLRNTFQKFFEQPNTFSLGVCNGCQMLSAMKQLIPGSQHWPAFLTNSSQRFESRLVMVKVNESPSIFFKNMVGACLPIPVAHGEGRAQFETPKDSIRVVQTKLAPLQYINNSGLASNSYPANPNGSENAIASLTSKDGRATILMPHPERAFMTSQLSWHPNEWSGDSPWLKIFQNARSWVDTTS